MAAVAKAHRATPVRVPDDNSATATMAGAGASAGRRPVLFAMDGAVLGKRVKFTAGFTQDFTARP